MKLPFRILVLDDDEHALLGVVELLRSGSYDVTGAATYEEARDLLTRGGVDLFVTDVRLRGFNGLNLVKRGRADWPDMAVIIISAYEDALMELEASRYQAVFLTKPLNPAGFLLAVAGSLAGVRRQRRWARKQVAGGFRAMVAGWPAAVVDVSYGGLRLEMPAGIALPESFHVELSGIGLQLPAQPVWWRLSDDSEHTIYGAALVEGETAALATWRLIVDRLTA
jgi:DNA-binding response OmpR family regulator